jgi:hypothetical protein
MLNYLYADVQRLNAAGTVQIGQDFHAVAARAGELVGDASFEAAPSGHVGLRSIRRRSRGAPHLKESLLLAIVRNW